MTTDAALVISVVGSNPRRDAVQAYLKRVSRLSCNVIILSELNTSTETTLGSKPYGLVFPSVFVRINNSLGKRRGEERVRLN